MSLIKIAKPLFDYGRRNGTRREITLPCQAVREHDFKLIADRTLDISTDGMLLPLRRPVLTGETILVSLAVDGMWIDAEAVVARIVHGRRPGDDGIAAGLVFDRLSVSSRAALAGYLHGRREPLPRRGPLAALRRGAEFPQLADEILMQTPIVPTEEFIDEADVLEDASEVDPLGILRAVAAAWQQLGIVDPA